MIYYGFGNYYLSSIQQGIQNAHVITKISVKYKPLSAQHSQYINWATNHFTMCCLNGGNSKDLDSLINIFDVDENPFPWSVFYEDDQSLNGALTAVGIILPSKIYDTAKAVRERQAKVVEINPGQLVLIENAQGGIRDIEVNAVSFSQWELRLIQMLPYFPLAK